MSRKLRTNSEPWHFPHIGLRILKTTIAVFLCLLAYWLRGYRGQDMPAEAAITAIICMQPYVRDSREYAFNRLAGTLIGAAWGLLFLTLMLAMPFLGRNAFVLYALMALGVMVSLHTAVLLRMSDASSLAAIVFICIVIAFPDIEEPFKQALIRIAGVLLGTFIAISVNIFRLPREKKRDRVFFVRTKDLVPDRFSQLAPAARFRLNYLYEDGARICLMSEHAPAFFTLQMHEAMLNTPLIVMDGAAIYDANENKYLQIETIPLAVSAWLRAELNSLQMSYFIYTIHHNKTCIFHHGKLREQERSLYDRLRRSPYRSYLEGEIYEPGEIVYLKIIAEVEELTALEEQLRPMLAKKHLRAVMRAQHVGAGLYGLYLYSERANPAAAEKRLMDLLRKEEPGLKAVEVFSRTGCRSEHDAMHLLYALGNAYEPVKLPFRKRSE